MFYTTADWLRLADGITERQGRAEIKIGGKWGTICDRWSRRGRIDPQGWPTLFCRNLGYKRAVRARVMRGASNPATGPINAKSPVCDEDAQLMTDCNLQGDNCWHANDVYVHCINY